jgi:hypothetical protein
MVPMKIFAFLFFLILDAAWLESTVRADEFPEALAKASSKASLATPGAQPVHLKLEATEKLFKNPLYTAEVEVWWSATGKWRREVKSPAFSQTAVQDGDHYCESNSGDHLPWWLQWRSLGWTGGTSPTPWFTWPACLSMPVYGS